MISSTSNRLVKVVVYGLLLTTLLGIAFAIREFGIIGELQLGNEVSDTILLWNDILTLSILILQCILFITFITIIISSVQKGIMEVDYKSCNEKPYLVLILCKLDFAIESILANRFGLRRSFQNKQAILFTVLLLTLLVLVFNPLMRLALSWLLPAENLFHYVQQTRFSLIIQIAQLIWVVFLSAMNYLFLSRVSKTKS